MTRRPLAAALLLASTAHPSLALAQSDQAATEAAKATVNAVSAADQPADTSEPDQIEASGDNIDATAEDDLTDNIEGEVIVVTAPRGVVIGNATPEYTLNENDIASYGVSSIADLVTALSPQTGTGRGGSGMPVVLLNGKRISSFAEIRNIPPEAIERTEIFKEEVALSYGYRADQRVVNIVLKRNYSAKFVELEHGEATEGGYGASEVVASLFKISNGSRLNLTAKYEGNTPITEAERDIERDSTVAIPAGTVIGDYRTLKAKSDAWSFDATGNTALTQDVSATLNMNYAITNTASMLGPSGEWSGQTGGCSDVAFLCDAELNGKGQSKVFHVGSTLDGTLGDWMWTSTANFDRTGSKSTRERLTQSAKDRSSSVDSSADMDLSLTGTVTELPAGKVRVTSRAGIVTRDYDSEAVTGGLDSRLVSTTSLGRDDVFTQSNIDIPIADKDKDVLPFFGKLSVNGNLGYRNVSDFGGLLNWGGGALWTPLDGLSFTVNYAQSESAPSMSQLGAPVIETEGVTVYDYTNGANAVINVISGGNPDLLASTSREWKLGVSYTPPKLKDLNFSVNYIRNRTTDATSSFPVLTPEIEAAFSDRVVRDASGTLISVDQRPVTFDETLNSSIRWGVNFSKQFGQQGGGMMGMGGAGGPPGGGRPGGGGGCGGGMMGGGPGMNGGRWTIGLFHTVRLQDEITIRPGVPVLDLLNGSATGSTGGSARHSIEANGGWFYKGMGVFAMANYTGGTTVDGSATSSTLDFGDLTTVNLRAFINFDSRPGTVKAVPFLKGSQLRLSVNNLFNAIQDVRDENGLVPFAYSPGFMDARGRYIELSFRKKF